VKRLVLIVLYSDDLSLSIVKGDNVCSVYRKNEGNAAAYDKIKDTWGFMITCALLALLCWQNTTFLDIGQYNLTVLS
jgi:hypothetical protein